MSADKVNTVAEIRTLVLPMLDKYDMQEVRLSGSCARSEADAESDIGLLLTGKLGFRPLFVYGVSSELREMTGKDINVFVMSELNLSDFRDKVLHEAVLLSE